MLRSGFNDLQGMPETEPLQGDVSEDELIPAEDEVRPYQKVSYISVSILKQ